MNKILFVGSNPSNASTCDAAFHGSAKSSQILSKWCENLEGAKIHINVLEKKTEGNRALTAEEIKSSLDNLRLRIEAVDATHIIALGKTAAKALTLLRLACYEMPHPSGLNRQLNDATFVEQKVKGLENYCSRVPVQNNT